MGLFANRGPEAVHPTVLVGPKGQYHRFARSRVGPKQLILIIDNELAVGTRREPFALSRQKLIPTSDVRRCT